MRAKLAVTGLAVVLGVAVSAAQPYAAVAATQGSVAEDAAAKPSIDLSGEWTIIQSDGSVQVVMTQTASGRLTGSAVTSTGGDSGVVNDGRVEGKSVRFTITWPTKPYTTVYAGSLNEAFMLQGVSYRSLNPKATATWYASRAF